MADIRPFSDRGGKSPHPWDVEEHGVYVFNFTPGRDDFSRVRAGNAWTLNTEEALEGNDAAMLFQGAETRSPEDCWIFSAGFKLRQGLTYDVGIITKLGRQAELTEKSKLPMLHLRMGRAQTPGAQNQLVQTWTVANKRHSGFIVPVRVEKNGVYFFSIEGEPGAMAVTLGANAIGLSGSLNDGF